MIRIAVLSTAIVAGFGATHSVEARGPSAKPAFETLDTDGDGAITQAELGAYGRARTAERFSAADADRDGLLSRAELIRASRNGNARRADRILARFDTNTDGVLSAEEMRSGGAQAQDARADRAARIFARADANGDGRISATEYAELDEGRDGRRGPLGRRD